MNLILVESKELNEAGRVRLSDARAAHMLCVLRVAPGHSVRVGMLDGALGVGTVHAVEDEAVELACVFDAPVPERPVVDLLLALPRPKVLQRLWAQLAALGVGRIILTNASRVERHYFDTHVLTPECYRPLLIEGLQQARDTRLPILTIHRQFKILIEDDLDGLFESGTRVVADPGATESVRDALRSSGAGRTLLAIGPEGGWNGFELALMRAHGFHPIGMGPRTLRTDTACLALLALAHDALCPGRRSDAGDAMDR